MATFGSAAVAKPEWRVAWGEVRVRQSQFDRDEGQPVQASRDDRIRSVLAILAQQDLSRRPLIAAGRLPHDIARALAESVVDAVAAADARVQGISGRSPRSTEDERPHR